MKISKISAAVAAFALVSGFAFADSEVKFSNKVSSDIVEIVSNDDDTETEFAGIKNKTVFEYASDNLDAMIELVLMKKIRLMQMMTRIILQSVPVVLILVILSSNSVLLKFLALNSMKN